MNTINIDGKIISNLELRKTNQKGLSVLNFTLRHSERKQKNPVFIDVECWGYVAEKVAETAREGSYVVINGELRRDVWEHIGASEEVERRSKLKIKAHSVVIGEMPERSNRFEQRGDESNLSF